MKLINCTRRDLRIQYSGGIIALAQSGIVPVIHTQRERQAGIRTNDGYIIEVARPTGSVVLGLPDPKDGIILITSGSAASAVMRPDVMSPGLTITDALGNTYSRGLNSHC